MNRSITTIVREIAKTILLTFMWALPVYVAKLFGSQGYLWLWVLSLFATIGIFQHYEDLEKIDKFSDDAGTSD